MQLKKLLFVIRYVPDQYKTQEMCYKTVDDYARALEFVPDRFKSQEMCIKAVSNCPSTIKYRRQDIF